MSNGDKILNRIKLDCDETVDKIISEARDECDKIISEARLDAEKASAEIAENAKQKANEMIAASKSHRELAARTALLKRRRKEIDAAYQKIITTVLSLPDDRYFELMYAASKKLSGMSGIVMLNKKDLNRLPHDFIDRLKQSGVNAELCAQPCDIDSGFVLKRGDVYENMDFTAILAAKHGEIEDFVNRELFAEPGGI